MSSDLNSIGVPATYLSSFLDSPTLYPEQLAAISSRAPFDIESLGGEQARIGLGDLLTTLGLIDEVCAPGWHIQPTLELEAAHHGPLGMAAVTAASINAAIDCLVRFENLRSPWTVLQASATTSPAGLCIRILPILALPSPGEILMEMNLIALVNLLAELSGRRREQLKTELPACYRPWARQLRRSLPGPAALDQRHYQVWIPGPLLALPCLLADPGLHASAVRRCEELLSEASESGPTSALVQQQLMAFHGQNPGLRAMATRLGLSSRTLMRRLEAENSRYRDLVDRVRQTLARDWLKNTDMPISRIAELLGYRDPANFGRAFRRWTGTSPGTLRRG